MAVTLAAQLDEVQTAISRILTGSQSMSAPDRAVAYAPLKELRDMERDLQGRIDAGNNGRRNLASF